MPRALLFFNAHRGQCQKRRRLKVITRRSSAEVRSSGVSVGVDSRKWRGKKTRKEELFGRCEPRWKLSWTDEAFKKSSSIVFRAGCPP